MRFLEGIIPVISAGARNENFTSVGSSLLMLGIVVVLVSTAIIATKIRKEI